MKRLLFLLFILSTLIACTEEEKKGYVTYVGSPNGDAPAYTFNGEPYNIEPFDPDKADVTKVVYDLMYVLNPHHGFLITSIGFQDQIEIHGKFSLPCEPVKMHIEGYRAYIMCNADLTTSFDEQSFIETKSITGKLFILDIEYPDHIIQLGTHEFKGTITDFRKNGDMLYIVSRLRGVSNEGCDEGGPEIPSRTLITSFDVSDPSIVTEVDQLHFDASLGNEISTLVTSDHIYVAIENNSTFDGISSIQAVDISDPSGVISTGNEVLLAGYINNEGQMSEQNSVLRVVSRGSDNIPVIETFTVSQTGSLVPSGSLTMEVALPDKLHSVAFDASRVFIVLDDSQDTVYSADLSNPAAPVQGSDIEISGDVHKMALFGDRLLTLSHDSNLNHFSLSMFDVSDLQNTGMVASVNFGSDYSSVFDEQKTWFKWNNFTIHPFVLENIISFQFQGWDNSGYKSGIQFFSFDESTLILREMASNNGLPRSLVCHNQRFYSVKDEKIDTFEADITFPILVSSLPLHRDVKSRVSIPNVLEAQLVKDPWSLTYSLEIVNNPDSLTPVSSKSLAYLGAITPLYEYWSNNDFSLKMFSKDNYIYLVRGEEPWYTSDESQMPAYKPLRVIVYDVSDPFTPTLVSNTTFNYPHGYTDLVDNTIVIMPLRREWYHTEQAPPVDAMLYGIDMSDPTEPVISFEIPDTTDYEYKGFVKKGNFLYTYHREPLSSYSDHEKYYLDRIDISDMSAPVLLEKINIPGVPVDFNPATGRVITVQDKLTVQETDEVTCWQQGFYKSHYEDGQCKFSERTLNFLYLNGTEARLNEIRGFDKGYISDVYLTESRLFVLVKHEYSWASEDDPRPVLYVYDVDAALTYPLAGSITLPSPYSTLTNVSGNTVEIMAYYPKTIWTVDTTNPSNITITRK